MTTDLTQGSSTCGQSNEAYHTGRVFFVASHSQKLKEKSLWDTLKDHTSRVKFMTNEWLGDELVKPEWSWVPSF